MLDDIGCKNQIKVTVGKGKSTNICQFYLTKSFPGAELNSLWALVDPLSMKKAEIAQHTQVGAATGADVKNFGVGWKIESIDNG